MTRDSDEGSWYDMDYDRDYGSERDYEESSRQNREYVYSQKLPRWQPPAVLNSRQQVDAFSLEVTNALHGGPVFKLLADGYVDNTDGFPHIGEAGESYHRTLVFHYVGKALFLVIKPYYYVYRDGSGGHCSVAVYLTFESFSPLDSAPGISPVLMKGFHACGGSRGRGGERQAWACSIPFEDNVYSDGLPSPEAFMSSIADAVVSIRELCDAPFQDNVWMGNYVDSSGWYSQGHAKTRSHELMWKRTNGGQERILAVAPKASFTTIWPNDTVIGPEVS